MPAGLNTSQLTKSSFSSMASSFDTRSSTDDSSDVLDDLLNFANAKNGRYRKPYEVEMSLSQMVFRRTHRPFHTAPGTSPNRKTNGRGHFKNLNRPITFATSTSQRTPFDVRAHSAK